MWWPTHNDRTNKINVLRIFPKKLFDTYWNKSSVFFNVTGMNHIQTHTHSFIFMFNWSACLGGNRSQWEHANSTQKRLGQRFLNSEMFYDSADGVWYGTMCHLINQTAAGILESGGVMMYKWVCCLCVYLLSWWMLIWMRPCWQAPP